MVNAYGPDSAVAALSGSLMTRRDEYGREGRWRRCLRLAVVALFVAWSFAGALHAPAFAAAPDAPQVASIDQLDLDATDRDSTHSQTCTAQGHCSGPAILAGGFVAAMTSRVPVLPRTADLAAPASVAPIDRPPILAFAA